MAKNDKKATEIVSSGAAPLAVLDPTTADFDALMRDESLPVGDVDAGGINKSELIGVPFVIIGLEFKESANYGGQYVKVHIRLRDSVGFFTDGSTGIFEEVKAYVDIVAAGTPVRIMNGLVKNDYISQKTGAPATTFHIAKPVLPPGYTNTTRKNGSATARA